MGCNTSQEKAAAVQEGAVDKNEADATNEDNKNNVEAELIKSKVSEVKNAVTPEEVPMLNGEPLGKDEG